MHIVHIYTHTYFYVSVLQFYLDDVEKKRVYIYRYIYVHLIHFPAFSCHREDLQVLREHQTWRPERRYGT